MLERVIVIGSPGAGKSTFSRSLREITLLPLYHLDMIWHKPDKTNISKEEFDKALNDIIQTEKWIIDGNYQRTLECRMRFCDTVFLLDYPPELCLSGARSRIGKQRSDMPWFETELDGEFRQCIVDFPEKNLPKIYALLEKYSDKNIVIFKSREQADDYLNRLRSVKA
ncbi:MAG TPA: adenylate kinase [Ruminococcaceae bacterium]|nr:adenylate kinase [Oscillospiraceae bacterium]